MAKKKSSAPFSPLGDRVVVLPAEAEDDKKSSAGGIIIPETVEKERPEQGKVVAVGPGRMNDKGELLPMSVKKGDVVLFRKYGPTEIKVDDTEYFILSESDILAVVEE